jgi:2-isopropylmalate synthase
MALEMFEKCNCPICVVNPMVNDRALPKITILDTTMRDGELTPGVKLDIQQKIELAQLLEEMQVDVIEVGYPGAFRKDFDELFMISKRIKRGIICGLASSKLDEVIDVALAIKPAVRGRIHIYTPVNLKRQPGLSVDESLNLICSSVKLARNYRSDVEWSAFDALNSEPDFLCRAIEMAIDSGATTINIPDTLGEALPDVFAELIEMVMNRVTNIDQATISVHCHDDRGLALDNSLAALDVGVRQIECAINGLGARKGNADLARVVKAIVNHSQYDTKVNPALLEQASELVTHITGIHL